MSVSGLEGFRTRLASSLENSNIRRYLIGVTLSHLGLWMETTAVLWLLLELTGSGTALGIHSVVRFGPIFVFGAYGGLLTDRIERLKLLKITQSLHAVTAAVLLAIVLAPNPSVIAIYATGLVQGLINAVDNPLRRGFVRDMSSDEELPNAVALNSTLATVNRTLGPALGGILIASVGIVWCFAINTVSYAALLIALSSIDRNRLRPPTFAPSGRGQVRAALRYASRDDQIWRTLAVAAVVGTFAWNYGVLIPVYATATMNGDATLYGLMLSTVGAGSFVGALVMAGGSGALEKRMFAALLAIVGSLGLAAVAPSVIVACLALFVLGGSGTAVLITSQTHLQLRVNDQMSGRIMALFSVAFLGSKPLGGAFGGWLIDVSGPRLAFGAGALVVGAVGSWASIHRYRSRKSYART
ncbi:MAG: MFS transporter [Acidimicrobiia bacterium]|nr:MFS transporter [Acidimicrobiia bacterium]